MTTYLFTPDRTTALVNGQTAKNMDYTGFDPSILALYWDGSLGNITYTNYTSTTTADFTPYQSYADYADSIILAQDNPVIYYSTLDNQTIEGQFLSIGDPFYSITPGHIQPANTTTLVPPAVESGQTLQWTGSDWVVASFPYGLTLSQAQANLIQTVTVNGVQAVNSEAALYSSVQQIGAPDVNALDTVSYPGTTLGDYQSYIDTVVSDATSTINSAVTVEELYDFNPASLAYAPAATGVIFTGRGSGLGNLDMNISYFTTWNGSTPEADTELYIPGTGTTISYGSGGPGQFDSIGNCFVIGNYLVQIRQASTGFVLAQYECPLNPVGESVNF